MAERTQNHTEPFPEPAPRPFAGVSRGFFQATSCQPCPALLQLVVSKSSGVKKQEAMQRRERIQIEARNCSSPSSPSTHPTPSSLPTPSPQATFSMRNALLALDGKLGTELGGRRASAGGEIQQHGGNAAARALMATECKEQLKSDSAPQVHPFHTSRKSL